VTWQNIQSMTRSTCDSWASCAYGAPESTLSLEVFQSMGGQNLEITTPTKSTDTQVLTTEIAS